MKKMVYSPNRIVDLLDEGKYMEFQYYIMNLGTHPTAYIEIPKDNPLFGKDYEEIDIYCHGGLTFSNNILYISDNKKNRRLVYWLGLRSFWRLCRI